MQKMLAILFTLKSFGEKFKNKHITILSDNTTAIGVINKMGSSKSALCDNVCHQIWEFAQKYNMWITCSYIPGKDNIEADHESRKHYKGSNWMLNKNIFNNVCRELNYYPDVDCLANRLPLI